MKTVIQRVNKSSVIIDGKVHCRISSGLLVFLGVEKGDNSDKAEYLAKKIVNLRIFPDSSNKMNLSVKDIKGDILLISQFTLCSAKKSGNRPGFSDAAVPEIANEIYEYFIRELKDNYDKDKVFAGIFGAEMVVSLENNGPVTILIEK